MEPQWRSNKGGAWYGFKGKQSMLMLVAMVGSLVFVLGLESTPFSFLFTTPDIPAPFPHTVGGGAARAAFWKQESSLGLSMGNGASGPTIWKKENISGSSIGSEDMGPSIWKEETSSELIIRNGAEGTFSPETGNGAVDQVMPVCDHSKGMWVKDTTRPFYSGKKCKMWLSTAWACQLSDRPNFDYENLRWIPSHGCDLPKFDGHTFLDRMRNKTIAFVGDSLGRQQYQSLMCMITEGEDDMVVEDVGHNFGLDIRPSWQVRPNGIAHRFKATNTTVIFYWSACLCEIDAFNSSDPLSASAMHLDRPATFLRDYLPKLDVVVLNSGHHWNRGKISGNRWQPYINGRPAGHFRLTKAHNFTMHAVVRWLSEKIDNTSKKVFYRTLSPRHFMNGDWDSGGTCDIVRPGKFPLGPARDMVAEGAVLGTNVHLLNITLLSQHRMEAHISKYGNRAKNGVQDCLHWCMPGVPDTWNEILFAQLTSPDLQWSSTIATQGAESTLR